MIKKEDLTYDYIHDSDVYVYQRKDMFRVNTDTSLLAKFMKIKAGERVIDIGTNNGALLLYAARSYPSYLCGIDIQVEACELAQFNLQQHQIENYEIICKDFKLYEGKNFDVALCNPPYFEIDHHRCEKKDMRSIARHEHFLQLEPLLANVSCVLRSYGRLYLVHRANRIVDLVSLCRKYQLEIKTMQFVYDQRKECAGAILIEAIKNGKVGCTVQNSKIISF